VGQRRVLIIAGIISTSDRMNRNTLMPGRNSQPRVIQKTAHNVHQPIHRTRPRVIVPPLLVVDVGQHGDLRKVADR
jgi:hypothetical protein